MISAMAQVVARESGPPSTVTGTEPDRRDRRDQRQKLELETVPRASRQRVCGPFYAVHYISGTMAPVLANLANGGFRRIPKGIKELELYVNQLG